MLINCLIVIVCCCLSLTSQQQQQQPPMPMPGPGPQSMPPGGPSGASPQSSGASLQLSIYQFLKQNKETARFASLVDSIAQTTGDPTIVNILSGQQPQMGGSSPGITVFVPVNEALGLVPTDQDSLRNDLLNFIVREALTLDRLASMNGQNISRTYGYKPNYMFRVVPNPYYINQRQPSTTGTSGPSPVQYQQQGNGQPQQQSMPPSMNMPSMMPIQQQGPGPQQQMMPPQPQPSKKKRQQFSTNLPNQQPMPFPQQMPIGSIQTNGATGPQQQQVPNGPMPQIDQDMNKQFPNSNPAYVNQMMPGYMQGGSVYDQYTAMYGASGLNQDPLGISSKLPKDQLYLLNAAVIIDTYQLTNGVVYLLNSYPRYYDKSFLKLLEDGDVNGLAQNLNFWITRATQAYRMGHENLRNALNAYGPNTYFLPSDQAINSFNNRDLLTNGSFLFDVLFRSHRISNQLLFDYYLDDPTATFLTDTGMPVSVMHRINNGQNEIELSIGHVKGKIYPAFRNIYCATGVIHLIDSVLGVPSLSAYQQIASNQELTIFRALIDRSSKYRQLLELSPGFQYQYSNFNYNQQYKRQHNKNKAGQTASNQTVTAKEKRQQPMNQGFGPNGPNQPNPQYGNNMQGSGYNNGQAPYNNNGQNGQMPYNNGGQPPYNGNNNNNPYNNNNNNNGIISGSFQYLTILAPRDASMIAIRDQLLSNQSAIDEFLAQQIIVDGGNRVFYTDHDENTFQNGQTYSTLNSGKPIVATVIQNPNLPSNIVTFSPANNPTVISRITYGNIRVMNGVVHIVDKPLSYLAPYDVTSILEKYASINSPGIRPFNQFVDILRNTGIFNDLREPTKQYTLFIPTNDALSRYKDILNSNDIQQQKNLIYRHMCLDQNLQSNILNNQAGGMYNQQQFNGNQNQGFNQGFNNNGGLICRNALGQDLTLMKDSYGLASTWQGHAYSKIIDDFSGIYSSAYVLEQPLLNQNLPNYGLNNPNSAYRQTQSTLLALVSALILSVILFF